MHAAIAEKKEKLDELCRRHNVARLEVFGSAACGTNFDPASSDADFLVEFTSINDQIPTMQALDVGLGTPNA
ncbi:MAG: nucleotidyltransferase domain-containing protein [Gammaproteobacteria bacterium]|nr:nucleotidyltransferase domain-containing protein [Gammaproteobacteria bacterium]